MFASTESNGDTMTSTTEPSDLNVGSQYTISKNKRTGDRSYTTDLWRLSALNDGHAELTATKSRGCLGDVIIVNLTEHDFFIANDFGRNRNHHK
jgi:hypothetical protein